ncbi:MAG: D-glycero-beta-D-manno-heptose 1-phosphate adenylyltransferase [Vicinamibacterales bacterium]
MQAPVQSRSIAVVGDIILDEYVTGRVERISPEAPVQVLNVEQRTFCLGGAANVAHSIAALGGKCTLVGKSAPCPKLVELLQEAGIEHTLIPDLVSVPRKTRFLASNQQLLRVDEESVQRASAEQVRLALDRLSAAEIVVVSDYDKGMVTQELLEQLVSAGKTVIVDPKSADVSRYKGVYLITPNLRETARLVAALGKATVSVEQSGNLLRQELHANVLMTRGAEGMTLFELDRALATFPTQAKEVFDVTGAGDTVVATVAYAAACGMRLHESVMLANRAAGIVIGKVGTATVGSNELFRTDGSEGKVLGRAAVRAAVNRLRSEKRKIVFTNGCFDLLHVGHVDLLKKAKALGDVLILGLNSDAGIRKLKGPTRPIVCEQDRAQIMAALDCVDYVVVFGENTPCDLIEDIRPDIHVKGGDYTVDEISMPEARIVRSYGGQVVIIDLVRGKSTTDLIANVRDNR